jgi:hypothetical protein
MREIKFRAWDKKYKKMWNNPKLVFGADIEGPIVTLLRQGNHVDCQIDSESVAVMQYTGLKDKKGHLTEIYEGDIISEDGKIIGNQYENSTLLKDKTNLLIQGFSTKTWCTTYQKALERGCTDAE